MSTNTVYCVNCDEKTAYTVKYQRIEMTVRGISFGYVERAAYCSVCGEETYVAEINDMNVASREEAYRKAAKLVRIQEINQNGLQSKNNKTSASEAVRRERSEDSMTNGDKIRRMTDEELADFFKALKTDVEPYCRNAYSCDFACNKCRLEWLRQEVEE